MSIKVSAFQIAVPTPQVTSNFFIWINGLYVSNLMIESATYPFERTGKVAVFNRGECIWVPGKSKTSGTWSCVLYESFAGSAGIELNNFEKLQYAVTTDSIEYISIFRKRNIVIAPSVAGTGVPNAVLMKTLVGAWIEAIEPVQVNSTDPTQPWKWNVVFSYDSIY